MNAGNTPASKPPKTQKLAEAELELSKEAAAIEKLRLKLSSQGVAEDRKQLIEFAKRQKAYLDGKIELEKLKRAASSNTFESAKTKMKPAPPAEIVVPVREKAPPTGFTEPKKTKTSRTKTPAHKVERTAEHWPWWLLFATAAGLALWLMR